MQATYPKDRFSAACGLDRCKAEEVVDSSVESRLEGEWWPRGHTLGWEHTFVHQITHVLDAIANNKPVEPYCATFEDGYKAAVIADALLRSAEIGEFIDLNY